jgi:hypothetical protein
MNSSCLPLNEVPIIYEAIELLALGWLACGFLEGKFLDEPKAFAGGVSATVATLGIEGVAIYLLGI